MLRPQEIMDLKQTLAFCAGVCEDCAAVGYSRIQYGTLRKWHPTGTDYADICALTASLLMSPEALDSEHLLNCERACRLCAEVCAGYDQEHCRICAKICLKCAVHCRISYQKLSN
ncbi:hypothetical protein SAMN04488522_106265 [Pedobacter caeni]|uniref:Four-helix bundle copper-binding protein n=2 Tax=Pedobacter caeni TaxID=288992 RepID=A0A1M5L986_9SPHI|nr:hypothetical protein SAMN04488522_106265 [Pedobacter caeni]